MTGDGLHRIANSPYWYYKIKVDGRWRPVSTKTANYQEAKRVRRKAFVDQEEGRLPAGEIARLPFERVADLYMVKAKVRLSPKSLSKEGFFLVRPKKLFGRVPCDRIVPAHIEQLQAQMKHEGRKNTYNNLVFGATKRVLQFAKVWRRIRDDVTRLSEREVKPVARVLQPGEKKRLFELAQRNPGWTTTYAAALISASTTARACDLRGQRWSDVDLLQRVMTIPESKSEAGKRRVPLNPDAVHGYSILLERASALGIAGPECFVFPACEHGHIDVAKHQTTWRTSWRALTRAADLRGLRFHDLRHQCITELLEEGAPEGTILSIAGHVSRKMMEHYSHIRMEAKREAVKRLAPIVQEDEPKSESAA